MLLVNVHGACCRFKDEVGAYLRLAIRTGVLPGLSDANIDCWGDVIVKTDADYEACRKILRDRQASI